MTRINCKKELVGDSVWVACSGGVDSIAIAHYLLNKLKRDVRLFHYNHNQRPQNDKMEEAVRKFAVNFNLPLEVRRLNFPVKGEDELRHNRYLALQGVAKGDEVIMGHHLNDCVESYLMNCFNGVPEYAPIPILGLFGMTRVIRPFMLTPKLGFENYAAAYNLNDYIVQDETNSDTKYRRNWIRNRCIPMIEEEYPGLEKIVFKKMEREYRNIYYQKKITCAGTR